MIRYTLLFFLLIFGCAGTRSTSSEGESVRRIGEYRFRSEQFIGDGTIVYRHEDDETRIILYSPFGKRIYELRKADGMISAFDSEGYETIINESSTAVVPSLLESGSLTYGELFSILSAEIPHFLQNSISGAQKDEPVQLERGELTVESRRGKLRGFRFITLDYELDMVGRETVFRSIKLKTGDKNYFHIKYE